MAPLRATHVEEPTWFNYLTVPLMVPITDMRGRTVTFTCRTYLPLTGLAFAHYLTRSRGFKARFGKFDASRVTLTDVNGNVVPLMVTHPNATGGPQPSVEVPLRGPPHHLHPPAGWMDRGRRP